MNDLLLSIVAQFKKADLYVFTIPSETLLFGAYLLQKRGEKVIIDLRDQINRSQQRLKILVPIYLWLYNRIENVVTVIEYIDKSKLAIHHGHDNLTLKINEPYPMPKGRFNREEYNELLQRGFVPRMKWKDYPVSGMVNIKHLWGKVDSNYKTMNSIEFYSWKIQANKMKDYLISVINRS